MADYQSIQMLAFSFARRIFAYRRLAQGLSRSLSAFSSFMREYLDKAIKADQCAQNVVDIGLAANDAKQLCANIRTVFECIRNAGLKLTISKCHFEVKQVDFLCRTNPPEGVAPQADKIKDFLSKLTFPKSKKTLQWYLGFLNYYRNYIPRLSERLSPFFKLLKFYIPTNLVEEFTSLIKLLENSCQFALRQPLKDEQIIVMPDASFTAPGYAIMIEDDPNQKLQSKCKTFAPIAFGSKLATQHKQKYQYMRKNSFPYILPSSSLDTSCGVAHSRHYVYRQQISNTIFLGKTYPSSTLECMQLCFAIHFVIGHVAGSMNTAADFFSRTEVNPIEKLEMSIRNDIQTKAIEVNIHSTCIVEEEQIYIRSDDEKEENKLCQEKLNVRNQAQNETHNEPENSVTELQNSH